MYVTRKHWFSVCTVCVLVMCVLMCDPDLSLLVGFVCRCGHQFCPLHRYADTHQCTYDYKTSGRKELGKHYPKIVAAKIEKL